MSRTFSRAIVLGMAASLCLAASALAQTAAPAQQSLVQLLASGFRVMATSFISAEAQSDKNAAMLVTLQKDSTIAVCTFSVGSWENIGSSKTATDSTICDVRGS